MKAISRHQLAGRTLNVPPPGLAGTWPVGLEIETRGRLCPSLCDSFWRAVLGELQAGHDVTLGRAGVFQTYRREHEQPGYQMGLLHDDPPPEAQAQEPRKPRGFRIFGTAQDPPRQNPAFRGGRSFSRFGMSAEEREQLDAEPPKRPPPDDFTTW